jgi:hypothetical protein
MNNARPNAIGKKAHSIDEFCETHGPISRAFYYKLRAAGRGPVEMHVGTRRLISEEAAAEWRRQMEAASQIVAVA